MFTEIVERKIEVRKFVSRKKQIIIGLLIAGVVIAIFAVVKGFQISAAIAAAEQRKMPPEAVTSMVVAEDSWPVIQSAVGTLVPVKGAVLGAEELGKVTQIFFSSGDMVQAGQVLVELDISVEEAQLKGSQAQYELALINVKRERLLREKNANSPSVLDAAESALRNADSEVVRLKALIARKKIVAPFAGKTGIRLVNEGQIVSPGTAIVSLQSFDPLFLNFSLPQQVVSQIKIGSVVEIRSDAYPEQIFKGTLTAIQPEIDELTRTVKVQATVSNSDEKLRPGMYVSVSAIAPERLKVLSIPISAIQYAPYGDMVFVIEKTADKEGKEHLIAKRQTVKLGEQRGDMVAVLSGLKAGDMIASSGTFKLRPDAEVIINNSVQPKSELAPRPEDT